MNGSMPRAGSGAQADRGLARGAREGRAFLDPAVVARLSHLDVRARLVVEGFIAGMHRSPFHGFSVEFAEDPALFRHPPSLRPPESGAGAALAFVALLGLVVGVVIVGQTQFALVREHLRELGMLRAVGASRSELAAFVAWQAGFVAAVGGASGIGLAVLLRRTLAGRSVELVYGPATLATSAGAVVVMCGLASIFSLATVLRLDVAKVLQ